MTNGFHAQKKKKPKTSPKKAEGKEKPQADTKRQEPR
jgi:hypothetical protein